MAIVILGKTECSLCGATLSEADIVVGFPHFIWDENHPLWRFSDSAMHQGCFAGWDERETFREIHNRVWPEILPNHPREMQSDGSITEVLDHS